jgi:pimeloyl-ACP methyl ester carboxylesterase
VRGDEPLRLLLAWVTVTLLLTSCGATSTQPSGSQNAATASPTLRPLEACVQAGDTVQQLAFRSPKGEQVVGAVLGNGDVGVVLAHQVQSDLCEWLPYAKRLRGLGRRTLIFDFGLDLAGDVVGAAAELRREGVSKVVLVGGSMGGTASLVAATIITPPVAGVASLSGPADFSVMDALAASKLLTLPVLYMAAKDDDARFPTDARAMYNACPSGHKQLLILAGNDHGSELLAGNVADQARGALEKFIGDVSA